MRICWSVMTPVIIVCWVISVTGCRSGKRAEPDMRKVKLDVQLDRFEKDFFLMDTNRLNESLIKLKTKYGLFYDDFLYSIAAFSTNDTIMHDQVRRFLRTNFKVYDSVNYYIPHLYRQLKEVESALKRAKVFFPEMPLPDHIITYIGPIDGYGSFAGKAGLSLGLQQFLGAAYSGYQSDYLISLFGTQRLRQFAPAYIAPVLMGTWINKVYPDKAGRHTLKDKMTEEGRKVFVLKNIASGSA